MKDKRRNSEKRKEKSRDAARCRRSKETEVFFELSNSLPLPSSITSQLDKASVMRLAISFLKMCNVLEQHNWSELEKEKGKGDGKVRADQLFPKALDGFVFILSHEGDIVYVNESIVKYLGIQQIELMGQSIFEFAHPRDEDEIREALSSRPHGPKAPITEERVFFLRMKCTLTAKGRNVNLKSASYKVIKCTGRLVTERGRKQGTGVGVFSPYLLAIGEPIPHPANIEMPIDHNTFLSKHDMNMRFTFCDDRVKELIKYDSDDLEGKSLYDYHHAVDSEIVEKAYKDLLARGKGQTMTGQYRFLAQGGGWVWVVTQATVIYNSRNQKAQWVVCVHYVLSHVEHSDMILSEVQLPIAKCSPSPSTSLQLSTDTVFTHKTEDMDQGYLIPVEFRDKLKLTKDNEPEDLTCLAPTAGDECVSLGFPSFSQVAMANLRDDDCTMSSPPALLTVNLKKEPSTSPALCRIRDQANLNTLSPASSSSSSRINSPSDYLKAASPDDVLSMDKFFQEMDTKADGNMENESIDFDARAPYIPMTGDEDLTLLPPSSESLITLQNEVDPGLFGKTEFVFKPKTEDIFGETTSQPRQSMRDMICGSTTVASIERPPDIMFQQIKRPLDMNSLEKGPPAPKIQRVLGPKQINKVPTVKGSKDSVLLNLLLTGEDPNGYKVLSPSTSVNMPHTKNIVPPRNVQSQLLRLTTRDCEVNAPTHNGGLLQGAELLKALEIDVPQTPR